MYKLHILQNKYNCKLQITAQRTRWPKLKNEIDRMEISLNMRLKIPKLSENQSIMN
uniref:Uncharacterized protein n=1 Tax=Manihot esculenta TaxID=3983 RepID=A0A2C9W3X0_MANES